MEWVSVNERLPEVGVIVKVKMSIGSISKKVIEKNGTLMDNGRFNCTFDWSVVTHWMPLPPPPSNT